MGIMYRVCDCKDWEYGMTQLDGFIMFGFTHGYKYAGKPFVYCPWCGKQIKDTPPPPSPEEEARTDDSARESTVYTATMEVS